jgi:signal transduction histidine kinase
VDGTLALVAFWLAHAVISMHQFPVWNLSWWLYHFLLCLGFLITTYILVSEYEQVRQFRLLRYYLGTALICTAFLALVASYLFAQFSHRLLVAEIKASTTNLVKTTTLTVAGTLPVELEPTARLANYAGQLPAESLGNVYLYDTKGQVFYPVDADSSSSLVIDPLRFEQALGGETVVEVRAPDEAIGNNPFGAVYTVETYTPLPGSQSSGASIRPAGVLVTLQAAPQLGQAILQARVTGLIVSALTMGALFIILLAVIRRADQIIASRAEELLQAYTSLRQAETMRDDLSHMIIHDLRNPLNIISATFELIRLNQGEARLKTLDHFWDSAYTATHRMIGLIDDILAVSKFEAGQLSPQFSATLLARLLAERLNGFKPQAAMENKQLALDCPPDLMVELDPVLMGRVIENLVSNAFKYTVEAEGIIHISACAENSQVRLSVRDNGEGIPDEYKERIFDKFTQASNTNGHSPRRGVGLGLAFCSLIVQAHSGQIRVTDAPGGGSEFVLTLPQRQ